MKKYSNEKKQFRINKISDQIQKEISNIFRIDMNDPRVSTLTITHVKTSQDIRQVNVFYTIMDNKISKKNVESVLNSAMKYIRLCLAKRVNMRYLPELFFFYDDSILKSSNLVNLINSVTKDK